MRLSDVIDISLLSQKEMDYLLELRDAWPSGYQKRSRDQIRSGFSIIKRKRKKGLNAVEGRQVDYAASCIQSLLSHVRALEPYQVFGDPMKGKRQSGPHPRTLEVWKGKAKAAEKEIEDQNEDLRRQGEEIIAIRENLRQTKMAYNLLKGLCLRYESELKALGKDPNDNWPVEIKS